MASSFQIVNYAAYRERGISKTYVRVDKVLPCLSALIPRSQNEGFWGELYKGRKLF